MALFLAWVEMTPERILPFYDSIYIKLPFFFCFFNQLPEPRLLLSCFQEVTRSKHCDNFDSRPDSINHPISPEAGVIALAVCSKSRWEI